MYKSKENCRDLGRVATVAMWWAEPLWKLFESRAAEPWKLVESQRIGVGGPAQCKLGRMPRMFAGENRPLLSGKVQKLYPRGDFVVSVMEINKLDQ